MRRVRLPFSLHVPRPEPTKEKTKKQKTTKDERASDGAKQVRGSREEKNEPYTRVIDSESSTFLWDDAVSVSLA